MKIIKEGQLPIEVERTCPYCQTVYQYAFTDIDVCKKGRFVICPFCKFQNLLDVERPEPTSNIRPLSELPVFNPSLLEPFRDLSHRHEQSIFYFRQGSELGFVVATNELDAIKLVDAHTGSVNASSVQWLTEERYKEETLNQSAK